jgi:hypothetical protein
MREKLSSGFIAVPALALLAFTSACSLTAPQYTTSLQNVQALKNAGNYHASVGNFAAAPGADKPISMRGSSMSSPYQNSYAAYLQEAVKQELSLAGKMSSDTTIEISGTLNKNDLDASGFSKGYGGIEARFVVKKGQAVVYDAVKSASIEWESSFAAAVALPKAQQTYPDLVAKLLTTLYADADFAKALSQ